MGQDPSQANDSSRTYAGIAEGKKALSAGLQAGSSEAGAYLKLEKQGKQNQEVEC